MSGMDDMGSQSFTPDDTLNRVAEFRAALLRFQQLSDAPAEDAGIGIRHYQCLLFIRMHPDPRGMPMGELAKLLRIQPATATGLIGRMEDKGLLQRLFDTENRRVVRLRLLPEGLALLTRLVSADSKTMDQVKRSALRLAGD